MMSFFRLVREVKPLQRGLLPQSATAIFLGSSTLRYVSSKRRLLREAMVLGSGSNVSSWDHLGSISPLATISMISANASLAGGGMEVELLNDTLWSATQCTLYPCVQRVSSHVDDAIYAEFA